jgi:hypothetical protein
MATPQRYRPKTKLQQYVRGAAGGVQVVNAPLHRLRLSAAQAAVADTDGIRAAVSNVAAIDHHAYPTRAKALSTKNPPATAPTLAAAGGGSLAAGVYKVAYSYVEGNTGQTITSPTAEITVTLNQQINVTAVTPLPSGVTAVNWFVSQANGSTLEMHSQNNGAAFAITAAPTVVAIADPPYPRNITANTTGTGANVLATQVTVYGTDINDQPISETLPIFTAGSHNAVAGAKAFKRVTRIVSPIQGAGVNLIVGFGDKCGFPDKLFGNTVLAAYLNGVVEVTPPTIVASATLSNNTFDLDSALNGTAVDVTYIPDVL